MIQNRAGIFSGKVKISMVCDAGNGIQCLRVVPACVVHNKIVTVIKCIADDEHKFTGITFFAVRGDTAESNGIITVDLGFEHLLVKTFQTAMEMVLTLIGCQRISLAIQRKTASADAVAHAADTGPHEVCVFFVFCNCIVTETAVDNFTLGVYNIDRLNSGTIIHNGNGVAHFVGNRI